MKKTTACCVASAIALSVVGAPYYSVAANTTVNDVQTLPEVKDANEFIRLYMSKEIIELDKDQKEVKTYELYTLADRDNYEAILKSKEIFDSLDQKLQDEILDAFEQAYEKRIEELIKDGKLILPETLDEKPVEDVLEEKVYQYNILVDAALKIQIEVEEEKKAEEESKKEDSKEESKDESKEEANELPQDESKEASKDVVDEDVETKDESKVESKEETEEVVQDVEPVLAETVVAPVAAQSIVQPASVEQVSKSAISNEQTSVMSSTASNFIASYLTSASGNIYATANSMNYAKIISGLSTWNKLSLDQKKEVNNQLKSSVGKTYQQLLQEAQKIRFGTTSSVSVNTATQSNASLFAGLCGISFGSMVLILKKLRREN